MRAVQLDGSFFMPDPQIAGSHNRAGAEKLIERNAKERNAIFVWRKWSRMAAAICSFCRSENNDERIQK